MIEQKGQVAYVGAKGVGVIDIDSIVSGLKSNNDATRLNVSFDTFTYQGN